MATVGVKGLKCTFWAQMPQITSCLLRYNEQLVNVGRTSNSSYVQQFGHKCLDSASHVTDLLNDITHGRGSTSQ